MILDDLDRYYRMKVKDPQSFMPRPGWSAAKVSWEFRIDDGGRLISIVPLGTEKIKYKQNKKMKRHKSLVYLMV